MTEFRYTAFGSPIGELIVVAADARVAAIHFDGQGVDRFRRGRPVRDDGWPVLVEAKRQLGEYLAGTRRNFDLPLDFGGTAFQRSVWETLLAIPYGETWSYADVANRLGKPTATRAVGAANGQNPIPIVGPCHRVIGKNGSLTGFGGGLPLKEKLLALESGQGSLLQPLSLRGAHGDAAI